MEFLLPFFGLFGFGCFGLVPTILAAAAIVDILRVRAELYWFLVVLILPVIGPAIYFLVYYGPWANRLGGLSPAAARRAEAKRRLRELEIQLQHWRGPSILAEAGEILLSLNKKKRAEALLQEAHGAGAELKEYALPLGTVLQVQGGRWSESLPMLEELVKLEPDYKFGAARLALARSLDELGETDRAEEELRAVLVKRNPPEAKVRLARLLLRRGDGEEAARLLAEVRADAAGMPPYLRREHSPWLRAARRVKASSAKLPAPKVEGLPPAQPIWKLATIGVAVIGAVLYFAYWLSSAVMPFFFDSQEMIEVYERVAEVSERIEGLRQEPQDSTPLEDLELDAAAVEGLIDLRRAMQEACSALPSPPDGSDTDGSDTDGSDADGSDAIDYDDDHVEKMRRQVAVVDLMLNELELRSLGLEDLARHVALVDWRLLARPRAVIFDLPAHFRQDYLTAQNVVEQTSLPEDFGPEYRRMQKRQQEEATAKIADLEQLASGHELSEATRAQLEARRAELASSLDEGCLSDVERIVTGDFWGFYGDWEDEAYDYE